LNWMNLNFHPSVFRGVELFYFAKLGSLGKKSALVFQSYLLKFGLLGPGLLGSYLIAPHIGGRCFGSLGICLKLLFLVVGCWLL